MSHEAETQGMRVLVTGARSGLGCYLHDLLGGQALMREDDPAALEGETFDLIVHCATVAGFDIRLSGLSPFIEDNLVLTERLTRLRHGVFVYLSSVDVYPQTGGPHHEDEDIRVDELCGAYPLTKLMAETLVRSRCPRHLILRPTTLLGRHARANNLIRLLTRPDPRLTLTADSRFNCVTHESVGQLILSCIKGPVTETVNVAASGDITLSEVAQRYGLSPAYGTIRYDVANVANEKARSRLSAFSRDSAAAIEDFLGSFQNS